MKRLWLAAIPLLATSCAKFPANGGIGNFTKITFRIKVAGNINTTQDDTPFTNYVYIVAIRALTTEDVPNTGAPVPVIGSNTPNGFVAGSPTHFVQFASDNPLRSYPFILYKFNPGPTTGDPDNPVNLASWFDTTPTRGAITNFQRLDSDPHTLQFELFVNQLVNTDADASTIKKLQINLLTMNRLATSGSSGRLWDALGNANVPSELTTTITVDLRSNNTVDNRFETEPSTTPDVTGGNDPDLDIRDFSVTVQQP